MVDPAGGLAYSDFVDSEAVEAAFVAATPLQRLKLLRWEYALRRAEVLGRPRPSSFDLYRLAVDMLWAGSPRVAGIALALASIAVLVMTGVTLMLGWQLGLTLGFSVALLLEFLLAAIIVRNVQRAFGRRARALRLVLGSCDLDPATRRSVMDEALELESPQA